MKPPSKQEYLDALKKRRIKFVAEKGSMARLFKAGTNSELQYEIYKQLELSDLNNISSKEEYDTWLYSIIEKDCWENYSRNGLEEDRWGYFAKLLNIIIYEILSNRELTGDDTWIRLRDYLHLPIDFSVTYSLTQIDPEFPGIYTLKGMSKEQYEAFQNAARSLGAINNIPPIWFEAAYSS